MHPSTISNWEKDKKRAQLGEEAYQACLNQPHIQFPLCLSSLIRNSYNDSGYSRVGNRGNEIYIGMDELLWQTSAMDGMLFHTF